MNETKAKELHLLLFSFLCTVHKKILVNSRQSIDIKPKLKKNQAKLLHVLYLRDSLTPTELGKMLDLKKGGLTTIIDQLEEMDLLTRGADPGDRRKILLSLTPAGNQYVENATQAFGQQIMELFQDVEPDELEQFIANLRSVTKFMQKL